MLELFQPIRDVTFYSISIRLMLAFLCGGIIGLERELKNRPAGFRTHILICLGAATTTMTSQYLLLHMHYNTDVARLGAQVVAGIGFVGAGTILVSQHQRIRGLTTAAGLWATAIAGLALGAGFYEGGIFVALLILIVELVLAKLEYRMLKNTPEVQLYVEYEGSDCLRRVLEYYHGETIKVLNMQIAVSTENEQHRASAIFHLRLKGNRVERIENSLQCINGVLKIEEL